VKLNPSAALPKFCSRLKSGFPFRLWRAILPSTTVLAGRSASGKLSVEKFASAREERDIVLGFDCDGTIAVAFNFFCGDESYVALTLIGDLAKRNFAEKHHII